MDSRDGTLYRSREAALAAGVPEGEIVEMSGRPEIIQKVARAVQFENRLERLQREMEEKIRAGERQRKVHANDYPPKVTT